jgi:hypothetical protein
MSQLTGADRTLLVRVATAPDLWTTASADGWPEARASLVDLQDRLSPSDLAGLVDWDQPNALGHFFAISCDSGALTRGSTSRAAMTALAVEAATSRDREEASLWIERATRGGGGAALACVLRRRIDRFGWPDKALDQVLNWQARCGPDLRRVVDTELARPPEDFPLSSWAMLVRHRHVSTARLSKGAVLGVAAMLRYLSDPAVDSTGADTDADTMVSGGVVAEVVQWAMEMLRQTSGTEVLRAEITERVLGARDWSPVVAAMRAQSRAPNVPLGGMVGRRVADPEAHRARLGFVAAGVAWSLLADRGARAPFEPTFRAWSEGASHPALLLPGVTLRFLAAMGPEGTLPDLGALARDIESARIGVDELYLVPELPLLPGDGMALVLTATPEERRAVGRFIGLVHESIGMAMGVLPEVLLAPAFEAMLEETILNSGFGLHLEPVLESLQDRWAPTGLSPDTLLPLFSHSDSRWREFALNMSAGGGIPTPRTVDA